MVIVIYLKTKILSINFTYKDWINKRTMFELENTQISTSYLYACKCCCQVPQHKNNHLDVDVI